MERRDQIPTGYVRRGEGEADAAAAAAVESTAVGRVQPQAGRQDFDWSQETATARSVHERNLGVLNYVSDAEARLLVGAKADYYLTAWKLLKLRSLPLSWNWAAFIMGPVWLAYRRMALFATAWILLWFLGSLIPFSFPLWWLGLHVALGATGNTLYHAHAMRIAQRAVVQADSDSSRKAMLMNRGGTGLVGPTVVILLGLVLVVIVAAFIALFLMAQELFNQAIGTVEQQAPFLRDIMERLEQFLQQMG